MADVMVSECCPVCKGTGKVPIPQKKNDQVRKLINNLYKKGWTMRRIMTVTGHKSVSTIAFYLRGGGN